MQTAARIKPRRTSSGSQSEQPDRSQSRRRIQAESIVPSDTFHLVLFPLHKGVMRRRWARKGCLGWRQCERRSSTISGRMMFGIQQFLQLVECLPVGDGEMYGLSTHTNRGFVPLRLPTAVRQTDTLAPLRRHRGSLCPYSLFCSDFSIPPWLFCLRRKERTHTYTYGSKSMTVLLPIFYVTISFSTSHSPGSWTDPGVSRTDRRISELLLHLRYQIISWSVWTNSSLIVCINRLNYVFLCPNSRSALAHLMEAPNVY